MTTLITWMMLIWLFGVLIAAGWEALPRERRVVIIYGALWSFQWYRRAVYVLGAGVGLFLIAKPL